MTGAPSAAVAPSEIRVAATVVLLRDAQDGLEVLLLERPRHRGAFAGAWVFPGGSVDPGDWQCRQQDTAAGHKADAASGVPGGDAGVEADTEEEEAARRAAVREVREETALKVRPGALVLAAKWTPPPTAPRRFRTWFYLAAAPAGEIILSPDECVAHAWLSPESALERHATGGLLLVPPTWVTLHSLVGIRCVAEALDPGRHATRLDYATRAVTSERGLVVLWQGDVAYDDNTLFDQAGARHRLDTRALPWIYSRSESPPSSGKVTVIPAQPDQA